MGGKRDRAYRRWKQLTKYVHRLKERLSEWQVSDEEYTRVINGRPFTIKKWRDAESWKELDEKGGHVKGLKDTPTPYSDPWKKMDIHQRNKKIRNDNKNILNEDI